MLCTKCLLVVCANCHLRFLRFRSVDQNGDERLFLKLNVEPEEYLRHNLTRVLKYGVRAVVHTPQEDPLPEERGYDFSVGFETSVALKKMVREVMKHNCVNYETSSTEGMTQTECLRLCAVQRIYRLCNCSMNPKYLRNVSFDCCTTEETVRCLKRNPEYLYNRTQCPRCLPSCREVLFDVTLSSAALRLEGRTNATVVLMVYFRSRDVTISSERPAYRAAEVFSTLGGHFSLFLGLSLVTVLNCVEKLLQLILKKCLHAPKISSNSNFWTNWS